MSREIHKKLSKEYFNLVISGEKNYEVRVADFECEPGDTIIFSEYVYKNDDSTKDRKPTGRTHQFKVGYVSRTKDFAWLERPDVKEGFDKHGIQIISLLDANGYTPWEVSIKAVIFNPAKTKVLLPLYDDQIYGLIGGHLEYGETFEIALRREIREETGVDFTGEITQYHISSQEWFHNKMNRTIHKIVIFYHLTLPEDTQIRLEPGNPGTISLDWVPIENILANQNNNVHADYSDAIKLALQKETK